MKKYLKRSLIFGLILVSAIFINFQNAKAEEVSILHGKFTMANGIDSEFYATFDMPVDGNVSFNVTAKDTDVIPGKMDIKIVKSSDFGTVLEEVKTITGVSSSQGLTDLNIAISAGHYYALFTLYTDSGDLSECSMDVELNINLADLPAPENITKLNAMNITKKSDIKDKYNKITLGGVQSDLVLPFTADFKGKLELTLADDGIVYMEPIVEVYQDKECTKKLGKALNYDYYGDSNKLYIDLPKKGTYYVKFKLDNTDATMVYSYYKVKLLIYNTEDRTLTNKVSSIAYQDSASKEITYKVNAPKDGLITLNLACQGQEDPIDCTVQLYNSKKEKVSLKKESELNWDDVDSPYNGNAYYTVKKGTYYIKVKFTSGYYSIKYTFNERKDTAGSKKSNAKKLNVGGASSSGYITATANTSDADWYTFTLKSDAKIEVYIENKSDGAIRLELLDSKGKVLESVDLSEGYGWAEIYSLYDSNMTKGTYYLKIYKTEKHSSISYSIKVKK